MSTLTRVRAAVRMALLWSGAFAVAGCALMAVRIGASNGWVNAGQRLPLLFGAILRSSAEWAVAGAAGGLSFALLLALMERNRRIHHLSLARVAAWGGAGAAVLTAGYVLYINPAPTLTLLSEAVILNGLAGGLAATTVLLLARHGSPEADPYRAAALQRASDQLRGGGALPLDHHPPAEPAACILSIRPGGQGE